MGDWPRESLGPVTLLGWTLNMYYKFIGSNKAESKAGLASVR